MVRIVSLLPSATEILYELGAMEQVLAVTHECNYPIQAKNKPRVIRSSVDSDNMTSLGIEKKIVELMHSGNDIFILNEKILRKANPDLIIAQGICEICSPFTKEINKALSILEKKPDVLILNPKNLDDILENITTVGKTIGKFQEAQDLAASLQKRIRFIKNTPKTSTPKVLCIEWLDPLFTAGHWIPQMIEISGGINGLSKMGEHSRRMEIDEVIKFDPDIIILMPCGFDVKRTVLEYDKLLEDKNSKMLKIMKKVDTYAVNANEYFSKPGPRIVTGLEIIAKIIHPDTFNLLKIPNDSVQKIDPI